MFFSTCLLVSPKLYVVGVYKNMLVVFCNDGVVKLQDGLQLVKNYLIAYTMHGRGT